MNKFLRALVKVFLVIMQPIAALAFMIASFSGSETAVVITGVLVVTYNNSKTAKKDAIGLIFLEYYFSYKITNF